MKNIKYLLIGAVLLIAVSFMTMSINAGDTGAKSLGCCSRANLYESGIKRSIALIDEGKISDARKVLAKSLE